MERSKTIEILKALATGLDSRSESSRLADIIDDVENALKAGVKRQAVLNVLHDHYDFKMTMSGFEKALRKLRNNKPPIPITTANTSDQLVSYIDNKNTDLLVSSSASKCMDIDLANENEEDEDSENKYNEDNPPKNILEFHDSTKKPLDIGKLLEDARNYKAIKKEEEKVRKAKK